MVMEEGIRNKGSVGGKLDVEKDYTYPTYAIILLEIRRLLDRITSYDGGISVIIVRSIGRKIDFPKQLLLMMLEFAHHLAFLGFAIDVAWFPGTPG
jgi:hypothetical protein